MAFYAGAARLLTKLADGSAKTYLKTLVLKAILETNISNFQRNTIKVLEPQQIFLGVEYKTLGNRMAENGVIFLGGVKEGKYAESYAAMYKGKVIEEFSKSVPEFATDSALAKESYKFFKQQKWKELEELFKARNINGGWPPNRGAFEIEEIVLDIGVEIDRYGGNKRWNFYKYW